MQAIGPGRRRDLPGSVQDVSVRAWGLRPRGGGARLALAAHAVLPSILGYSFAVFDACDDADLAVRCAARDILRVSLGNPGSHKSAQICVFLRFFCGHGRQKPQNYRLGNAVGTPGINRDTSRLFILSLLPPPLLSADGQRAHAAPERHLYLADETVRAKRTSRARVWSYPFMRVVFLPLV